ncbi:SusC/RagA family TonB-linked outer membrane protein [Maribacter algicola]|uniref:SusC/RagA family TonB-linked outer membrane protein n=1 Tax=Meishania litoralis TaxID=3434685 RepID=A0ACC7LRA8_9FLAO
MKIKLIKSSLLLGAFLCFGLAKAQTVSGTVSDETGPLPGANVIVKGTTNGTQTDFDGNYTLDNVGSDGILVFSYIGYRTVEVPVNGQTTIDQIMEEDAAALDEVVVTGYGSQTKRDVTGSVATVDAEELTAVPATTFAQQLQGRAAGIGIVNDATPGGEATVRIRGFGTIGNNDPLYIIDGVPSRSQANLNPGDIESLQVLKDASAASIYGSRAANGVIIITTKQGKMGKPVISFETFYGTQSSSEDVEALNAEELGSYLYLADLYAGKSPGHGQYTFGPNGVIIPDYVFPSGAFEGDPGVDPSLYALEPGNIYAITRSADTNWWKETTRSAPIQNYQISASGATESARYAFTLNHFAQDAITKFVGYNRTSIRANTEFRALNNRLAIGENLTVSFDNRKGGFSNDSEQNTVSGAYKHHPLLPIYDIAGNFAGSRGANLGNNFNPYAVLHRDQDDRRYRSRVFGNVYASYDILDNLEVKTSFGIDAANSRVINLRRPQPEYVEGNFINGSTSDNAYEYQWQWNTVLTYDKTFNEVHNFNAYVGIESIQAYGEFFNASRNQFAFETTDILRYLRLGDATTASNDGASFRDFSLFSQFGQFKYDYDGKYLAQFTIRNDASSRFQAASRSAVFPAFSLGWRVSDEKFMENVDWIDELKLRYGWGKTGNQEIGDYNAFTTYRSNIFNAGYPIDGSTGAPTIGFDASGFGNPDAKWETTTSNNFGIDLLMLDRKLNFNLDIWDRVTSDMLFQSPVTYSAGDASAPFFNVGQMTNKGIDLNISWDDSVGEDWSYGISFNLSQYKNEVDKLSENADTRLFGDGSRVPSLTVTEAGTPISSFYGFKTVGLFQSQAEADAWPAYGSYNAPGKLKVADVNGDGVIDDDDRTIIGSPHPDFTYGINLDLSYKNLALNVFGNGSQGNDIYNYVRYFADFNTFQGNRSKRALYEAWQPTDRNADPSTWVAANPNATVPIMDANDQVSSRPSSYFIEDGSYFRLKNVSLTYTLPQKLLGNGGISNFQIYAQGQNLYTWTKYTGLNPEIQAANRDDDTLGFDGGYMPVARTYTLGLRVSFK